MPEEILEDITEEKSKRLFAAVYAPQAMEQNDIWSLQSGDYNVDKMKLSSNYFDQLTSSRFFYAHDGLVYTAINKQVEIGINGYNCLPSEESPEQERIVYEHLDRLIQNYLVKAALEYLISGLVVPEITWGKVKASEISPKLKRVYNRTYTLPIDLWHRDPSSIILKRTPLPNQVATFVRISDSDKSFIEAKGVFSDGTSDKEAYYTLIKEFPEFVTAVRKGQNMFKLDDPLLIRRCVQSSSVYPTQYLLPALELLIHKRNLRKMDYAIAARVISAIQLFKMGNDEYPLTEDDDDLVEDIKAQMRWRGAKHNTERIFQLFANHTLDISWITPDVKALLDEGKYRSINEDIVVALGLPRLIISGEALRSGSSSSEYSLLPPASTIEAMREALLEFPRKLYREVKEQNNFKGCPEPHYPPIRLLSLRDLMDVGKSLYESAIISRTGWAEMANFDYNTEMHRMVTERDEMKRLDLPEFAPVPFSPQPNVPSQNKKDSDDKPISEAD